uniref:Uncharacterized protein n=1 Tax=Kalanchoe fedtschenkoi TaxID=63787 RepID=A0A7N0ZX42_KALFE
MLGVADIFLPKNRQTILIFCFQADNFFLFFSFKIFVVPVHTLFGYWKLGIFYEENKNSCMDGI